MEEQGHPEPTGMAKVTDAFNLPSKHVIHMVGPIAQATSSLNVIASCVEACCGSLSSQRQGEILRFGRKAS